MKNISILIVIGLSLIGVIGDALLKLAGANQRVDIKWFILGFSIYASTALGWFFVMKYLKLATIGVFYSIATVLFLTAFGTLFFKEQLSLVEFFGIFLAIFAIIILGKFA